jgi:hypothetical protein
MAAVPLRAQVSIAPGFRFNFKTLSSDVCEYRDGDRKFWTVACCSMGADYCQTVSGSFLGAAYAAIAGARRRAVAPALDPAIAQKTTLSVNNKWP